MRQNICLIAAGIPEGVREKFLQRVGSHNDVAHILSCRPLDWELPYNASYAEDIYEDLVNGLHVKDVMNEDIRVLLLYVDKDSSSILLSKFDVELLAAAFTSMNDVPRVRDLTNKAREFIERTRKVFSYIHGQYSRRNTPLLLPPKNFGSKFRKYAVDSVQKSVVENDIRSIQKLGGRIRLSRGKDKVRYFASNNIFFEPARARHGMAPAIGAACHSLSCGIRGRLRFGVPFDPTFHYDCTLRSHRNKKLYDCCVDSSVMAGSGNVNIAPNDNIRK